MSTEVITAEETLFRTYDAAVIQGREVFEEVVSALKEIHAKRLYRIEFSSFEDYVHDRLGWSKAKAYRALDLGQKEPKNVSHGETDSTQINTKSESRIGEITDDEPIDASYSTPTHHVGMDETTEIDPDETSRPQQDISFAPCPGEDTGDGWPDEVDDEEDYLDEDLREEAIDYAAMSQADRVAKFGERFDSWLRAECVSMPDESLTGIVVATKFTTDRYVRDRRSL